MNLCPTNATSFFVKFSNYLNQSSILFLSENCFLLFHLTKVGNIVLQNFYFALWHNARACTYYCHFMQSTRNEFVVFATLRPLLSVGPNALLQTRRYLTVALIMILEKKCICIASPSFSFGNEHAICTATVSLDRIRLQAVFYCPKSLVLQVFLVL